MAKSNYASMQWGIWERDNQWDRATPMQILNRMLTAYELYDLALHHTSPTVRVTVGNILVERYTQLVPQGQMSMWAGEALYRAYKRRPNEALRRRLSQYMVIPQY